MEKKTIALDEGNVKALFAKLAIPAILAQLVNLLYNIVDRIYIGHIPEVGKVALTGVGLFTPIFMLYTAFAMLVGSGGAPRVAISLGKGDKETAEKIIGNSFVVLLGLAVVLSLVFYFFAPDLLMLFGASENTLPYGVEYARIYSLGSVTVLMVLGLNPFITSQGYAKISMLTTVIGAVINIILDPIFIFALKLGVRGAAFATVLSQGVGAVWVIYFLVKKSGVALRFSRMKLEAKVILPCLALGLAAFIMTSTESILSISFNSSLSKYGGDIAVGAMTILTSLWQLLSMPLNGLCQGGQPIMSYNYGANKPERVKEAFRYQMISCVAYGLTFWLLTMLIPGKLAAMFTTDAELITYTVWAMRIYMICCFTTSFQICCQQSFVGLGQAKISLFLALYRKAIILIPLIYILPHFFADKAFAVFVAEPVSDVIAATTTTVLFFMKINKILYGDKKSEEIA